MDIEEKENTGISFKDVHQEKGVFRGYSFSDCTFTKCRFERVDFTGSAFFDCVFNHCELSLTTIVNASLRDVQFKDCKLVGIDFTKCDPSLFRIGFDTCLIDTCNFSSLKLKQTRFIRSIIRESRFIETILQEADFEDSDLEQTLFHQCDLEKANFSDAKNYSINPLTNKIKGAIFSLPEAVSLLKDLGICLTN